MTYKEHIYNICENTDLDDREDVTETMAYLAKELMRYQDLCRAYENKIKEIMTAKDYEEWSVGEAKKLFKRDIEMMEDSDFKSFCIENFDIVTDESLSVAEVIEKIGGHNA